MFTVSLSTAAAFPVTVDYATTDGTAIAGSDYTAVTGTLTFAPGETTQTVMVALSVDPNADPGETFMLQLSNASSGAIADASALATILDMNSVPTLSPIVLLLLAASLAFIALRR